MSSILTQEEVDALLRGISGGKIETEIEEQVDPSGIITYDLTSQDRIIRGRMPTLEMTNEKFARMFRTTLSSTLRKVVNVTTLSTDMIKFGEFLKTLPVPTSMHLFKMDPMRGSALFVMESKIIFLLVDIIFGGSGTSLFKVEGREFTAIENNLIKRLVLSALADLEKAWKALIDLTITYQRSEINPQFMQVVPPTDVVVVVNFEIEMDYASGIMSLCIPYSNLEPIRDKLQTGYQSEQLEVDKAWAQRFKDCLMSSNAEVVVELGQTQILGKELVNLQKGDVVRLDRYVTDPFEILVEGVPKYTGFAGLYKGNQAVQIEKIILSNEGGEYGSK
jgi:flagellar motor switch protein FliM